LDVLWALLLIGVAAFLGGILLRRVPGSWLGLGIVLVVFGLGIPALVIDDNKESEGGGGGAAAAAPAEGGEASGGGGGEQAGGESGGGGGGGGSAASEEGKLIFTQSCGTCHTLADAGTNGQVGPNLDQLKPNKARVEAAIKNGGTGSGTMPACIVSGQEETQVADYVSSVAGK
jgi:hypothetical protein